jgi:hypothetical protein
MLRTIRSQLNPATALAIVALFASLGGVSYAAATIGTSDIENGAVNAKKLKRNAVSTPKIRVNAVTGAKVNEGTLSEVPKAAKADSATTAGKASLATDSEQLGGHPASSYGSGIVGAMVSAPGVGAGIPSGGSGSPIGDGDSGIPMPVPTTAKNLFVRVSGDPSRPFVAKITDGDDDTLTCAGSGACFSPAAVDFETGDLVEMTVTVLPGGAAFAGAVYQAGYQLTP